jgi:hypothetical protein
MKTKLIVEDDAKISMAKPMERAFSALASAVRVPSPLGWAGMMGGFGAPRCAGAAAPAQACITPKTLLNLNSEVEAE